MGTVRRILSRLGIVRVECPTVQMHVADVAFVTRVQIVPYITGESGHKKRRPSRSAFSYRVVFFN